MSGLTEAQHEARSKGLGGSDVAAVLGISPWKTPFHLYLEKTGELPRDTTDNRFMRWGSKLERLIVDETADQRSLLIHYDPDAPPFAHRDHSWALVTADGLAEYPGDGEVGVVPGFDPDPHGAYDELVEAKTASVYKAAEWAGDEIPVYYMSQVQWGLEVLDLPSAVVAVLIGGNDFRIYDVERDRDLGRMLLDRCGDFWERVERRDPPDPDGAQSTTDALNRLYATVHDGAVTHVGSEVVDLAAAYWRAHAATKAAEEQKNEAANRLRVAIGEHEAAVCDGQTVATWKAQSSHRFDSKAFRAAHPDLYDEFAVERTVRVLRPSAALKEE